MATFTAAQVGLSYPKSRCLNTKIVPINRTDASTQKCVIPKDAVVVGIHVMQTTAAVTGAGAFNLGWAGSATSLLNAYSMPTSTTGLANAGAAAGSGLFTKLDSDKMVIASYTVGSSSAGGTGYVVIEYFLASGNEGVDD